MSRIFYPEDHRRRVGGGVATTHASSAPPYRHSEGADPIPAYVRVTVFLHPGSGTAEIGTSFCIDPDHADALAAAIVKAAAHARTLPVNEGWRETEGVG